MRSVLLALGTPALVLGACSGSPPRRAPAPTAAPKVEAVAPQTTSGLPAHTVARSVVRAAVARGLGAFLQHVDLDDNPVRVNGKFRGFRIAALRDADFWAGVDLKPGDVVTRVNGFPIERPEQAQTAFESLQVASELRVAYDRDGEPREIVYSIVEDR